MLNITGDGEEKFKRENDIIYLNFKYSFLFVKYFYWG